MGFSGGGGSFTADGVTLETTSGGITRVKDGGLGTAKLSFSPERVIDSNTLTADGTTLSLTGLNLGTTGVYKLHYGLKDASGVGGWVSVYVNGDQNLAHYAWQNISANNASVGAGRANSTHFTYLGANDVAVGSAIIGLGVGQIFTAKNLRTTGQTGILWQSIGIQKTDATVSAITSISLIGDQNFLTGSWLKIIGYD